MESKMHVRTVARILSVIAIVCAWSAGASAQSCAPGETAYAFSFTGGQQTLTVPAGVAQATVFLSGAQGGSGRSGAGTIGGSPNSPGGVGGLGGRVRGTLQVTPGEVLTIGVGGQGSQAVNPGGIGQGVDGIGGGATDLQRGGSRVAIAGGGGGGGNAGWSTANVIAGGVGGVGGGGVGGAGATVPGGTGPFGGGGGSVGTGGAGGVGCGGFPATAGGANGDGGDSFNFSGSFTGAGYGGGGGGGAVTGGGGGGAGVGTTSCQQNWNGGGGGGAGGSSGATGLQSVVFNNGVQSGNGSALICFAEPRFLVGGTGSSPNGPVILQLTSSSGPQNVTVAAGAAGFTFPTGLLNGTSWSASIVSSPAQEICTLQPTSGTIVGANITNLVLACTVVTVDIAPTTLPGGVSAVAYGQTLTALSPNGGTAPFSFGISSGALPTGLTLSSAGVLSGTPNTLGTFNFTVQATSANGFSGTRAYSVTIVAPVIALEPQNIPDGVAGTAYAPLAYSATGGTEPYSYSLSSGALPAGMTFANGELAGTPTVAGNFNFTVTATDANGFTGSRPYTVAIAAPTISIEPVSFGNGTAGTAYGPVALSAEGGATPYSYAVTTGSLPAGITLTNGELTGTPTVAGNFNFTVTATDANGFTGSKPYTVAIAAPTISIEPVSFGNGMAGTAYGPVALSAQGGAAPYTFALTAGALPAGMSLTNGQLAGTPTVAGNFTFTVTATDANGFTGARVYTLNVDAPGIDVLPDNLANGTAGTAYGPVALSAQGGAAPYTFAMTAGALPAGMSLTNGELTGTPTVAGNFTFTVTATDANGFPGENAYTLTVDAPEITLGLDSLPNGTGGEAYGPAAFAAAGGTAPYSYTLTDGTLPAGMTLTNGDLTGTPTVAGSFTFTVTATDANGFTGERAYALTIAAPEITLGPDSLPIGTGGEAFGPAIFAATGGTAPYTYELTAGALPAGMTLTNGELTGTPTVAGNFNVSVTATDTHGFTGERAYTLTIEAPEITLAPGSLPSGNVLDAYSAVTISAEGGTAPYSFALTAGALPAGLSLSGNQISGTPTASGSFNFTVTATDNLGFTGEQAYTLVIERTLPEAQDHTLTVLAGTTGTVDLTQGAVNGPFTNAAIVTPPLSEAGEATIVQANGTYILSFAALGTFSGATSLTYTLANSDGVSAPATVTINVTPRADPSRDPEVIGLIRAQTESTKRFANTQIRHFHQRLEQLHNEGERRTNALGVNFGIQSDPNDTDAYAEEIVEQHDPALDAIRRLSPDAAASTTAAASNSTGGSAKPLPAAATAYAENKPTPRSAAPATGTTTTGTSGSAPADPIVSESPFGELAFWSGGYVNFGRNDDGGLKLDNTLVGVSAGADYRFSPVLTAGLGFGYGRDVTDVGDNGTESRAEAFSVAVYGSYRPVPGLFIDGLAGYGSLNFDSDRYVTGTGDFASGSRSGDQTFASLSAGYEYRQDTLLISPYGRISGSRSTLDGFSETGAGLDNLTFGEQKIDTLSGTLGLRLEKAMPMDWGVLTPRLRLEYTHDFEGSSRASMGYVDLGTLPYAFDVEAFSQDLLSIGLGFDAQIGEDWNFGMDYSTVIGTDGETQDHTISARFGIQF